MSTQTVVADITMSLDGYVTGPNPDLEHGLGHGGEPLHDWVMDSDDPIDAAFLQRAVDRSGAVVMGRRTFDLIDGPHGWSEDMGYGAGHAAQPPIFVVTHEAPARWRLGDRFKFATGGIADAIDQGRDAAGDRDVVIMGGGDVIRQALDEGLVDELLLHIAPIVLGAGAPLFAGDGRVELEQVAVEVSRHATHATYRVAATSP
jgi:dihydrofolate reductase